ncbi:hypothetical protein AKJ09_01170 [Labilithrix luteola]|uniref:Uncharacterized protein n=1 Tax=Labilithrix luteola TaxID=1391654 RepID=A0A0K1PM79_9BACT|nr:hypothetical protein AKJ09_01170 [Labilithrix luteola]
MATVVERQNALASQATNVDDAAKAMTNITRRRQVFIPSSYAFAPPTPSVDVGKKGA